MAIAITDWDLDTGCVPCYQSVFASRLCQMTELGNLKKICVCVRVCIFIYIVIFVFYVSVYARIIHTDALTFIFILIYLGINIH